MDLLVEEVTIYFLGALCKASLIIVPIILCKEAYLNLEPCSHGVQDFYPNVLYPFDEVARFLSTSIHGMPGRRQWCWACFNAIERLPMPPRWEHFQQSPSSNHQVYRHCDSVSELCTSEHTFGFGHFVLTNANVDSSLFATKAENYPHSYFRSAHSQVTAKY